MGEKDTGGNTRSDASEARRVVRALQGTLVRDLRSMMKWAVEFDARKKRGPQLRGLGALNFTLMMVALIGCETAGFYTEGAYKHLGAQGRLPDPGIYLMLFIQKYFRDKSYFKKLAKVLADELRHDLVHGFGSLGRPPGVSLALAVNRDTSFQIVVGKLRRKDTIGMNSVAFADQFLIAFRRVKNLVDSGADAALAARIARAAQLQLPIIRGVQNQFEIVYRAAQRKGLVTTFGRRRRFRRV